MTAPRAALLTGMGRGAVATVAVFGAGAVDAVNEFFRPAGGKPLSELAKGAIRFGRWGGAEGEEIVASLVEDNAVEIHCHGGRAASRRILDDLCRAHCVEAKWTDWAVARGASRIQIDAIEALRHARTERAAAILLDQHAGALENELRAITAEAREQRHDAALRRVNELLRWRSAGLHLATPFRIVISGRPNVGKSSLMNALVGYSRAIVYEQPGTTRDVVSATTAIAGFAVEIADTAGLRETSDELEAAGIERARRQIGEADLQLLVFDASVPWDAELAAIHDQWPEALVVHNKCDLVERVADRPAGVEISVLTGQGLDRLLDAIVARLVPEIPPAQAAVPFTAEQIAALKSAAEALAGGDAERAVSALESLVVAATSAV